MKLLLLMMVLAFNPSVEQAETKTITVSLRNMSAKSIPLIIPSVMNPNLSPFSKSGVYLKVGQKVFFKHKGKKKLLFEAKADDDGKTFYVSKLIKERKKELGLD